MAENDLLKRLLDAGVAFTQMTQKRAEDIVSEFVRSGEMRTEQAQTMVQELVEKSRQNTDRFLESVRKDIRGQVSGLGLATREDVESLRAEIASLRAESAAPPPAGPRKTAAKKAPGTASAAPAKRATKSAAGTARRTAKKA